MKRKQKNGEQPKKLKKSNSRDHAGVASVNLIIFLLDKLSDWVYQSLIEGFFGRIFTAYSAQERAFERGFIKNYFKRSHIISQYFRRCRAAISSGFENSWFLGKLRAFSTNFKRISVRTYGNFFLSFGVYTILIYFIKMLLPFFETDSNSVFLTGLIVSLVSLPLLTSTDALAVAAGKSRIVGRIFVSAFGFREEAFRKETPLSKHYNNVMTFLGMVFGTLTFFVHPLHLLTLFGIVAGILLIFATPEIGVLSVLFVFPFLSYLNRPTIALALLVVVTFLAYLCKLLRGKRILKFDFMDWIVLIFGVALYFSGRISAGGEASYQSALLCCALMLGYFLVVNLMRTKQWIHRCFVALVSSATAVSVIGIAQYFFGALNRSTMDMRYFSDIKGRVTSLFDNPNVLGFYLVAIFPITLYFLVRAKGLRNKLWLLLATASMVLCTVFTWSRGAWLAMLLSTFLFLLIYTRKTLRYFLLSLLSIPFLAFLLPQTVIRRFLSIGNLADSSTTYRLYTWRGTLDAISDYWTGGVGYGTATYQQVYPGYAYAGMASAEHSHSLILHVLFSMGVFALIIFLFVVLLFVQRNLETINLSSDRTTQNMLAAVLCCGLALLIMGLFDDVWYHYHIFFLFWSIFGFSSALSRIDACEREQKQMLQINEPDYASVDFEI